MGKGVWLFLPRKVRRRISSHTSDDGPDRDGERCAKGPFLLEAVASAGCGEKVDGIPTGKSRHQAGTKSRRGAVVAEHCETPRCVVGSAHTTADADGEQKQLPCCERGCECLIGTSKGILAMTSHSVCTHSHPSRTGKGEKGGPKEGRRREDRLSFAGALPRHGAVRQCLVQFSKLRYRTSARIVFRDLRVGGAFGRCREAAVCHAGRSSVVVVWMM